MHLIPSCLLAIAVLRPCWALVTPVEGENQVATVHGTVMAILDDRIHHSMYRMGLQWINQDKPYGVLEDFQKSEEDRLAKFSDLSLRLIRTAVGQEGPQGTEARIQALSTNLQRTWTDLHATEAGHALQKRQAIVLQAAKALEPAIREMILRAALESDSILASKVSALLLPYGRQTISRANAQMLIRDTEAVVRSYAQSQGTVDTFIRQSPEFFKTTAHLKKAQKMYLKLMDQEIRLRQSLAFVEQKIKSLQGTYLLEIRKINYMKTHSARPEQVELLDAMVDKMDTNVKVFDEVLESTESHYGNSMKQIQSQIQDFEAKMREVGESFDREEIERFKDKMEKTNRMGKYLAASTHPRRLEKMVPLLTKSVSDVGLVVLSDSGLAGILAPAFTQIKAH